MQKKKKKNKLFIFLIICFVLMPFLFTKGCNYMESLNQAENSISEPISSASAYSHIHERAYNTQGHSIRKANWTGTAVPNSGYVENVYFNTNLNVEDVASLLSGLTSSIEVETGLFQYPLLVSLDGASIIIVYKSDFSVIQIQATAYSNVIIFSYGYSGIDASGWIEGVENPLTYNIEAISKIEGMPIGTENDKLKSLFSITPFEQSSNNELSIGNLFTQLGNAIIIFGGAVVNVFISMEPIFWNEGPTLIFILLIASVSFALVFWGIELLISLIGVFKTKRKKKK